MVTQTLSAERGKSSPAARAGHSVIRVPRTAAGLRGPVQTERTMTDSEFLVYLAMVDLADNKTHRLVLNTRRIAARAGVPLRTVQHVFKSGFLIESGLVEWTAEAHAVTVIAPAEDNGGFLSIPRAALWTSTDASIETPAYVIQSLLVLMACGEWSEKGTTITASRHRQTMANGFISLKRFERGLQHIDQLDWVLLKKAQYDSALASAGMARRMPTIRVIEWRLLAPYKRLEVAQEAPGAIEAPAAAPKRESAPERLQTAPATPSVPRQRATVSEPAMNAAPAADMSLLSWVSEGKGIDLRVIAADAEAAHVLIKDTKSRLARGWTLDELRDYCRIALLRTKSVDRPIGWLRSTGLPSDAVPVGQVPQMSAEESKRVTNKAARDLTWQMKQASMAVARSSVIVDDSSPF